MQITLKNLERLMLMILKYLRRLPKIGTMLILKRKGIQKSIKKPLKPIIVSAENKYVVKKGKNMCYIQICKTKNSYI